MIETKMSVQAGIKRGPESWAFIYTALGFALTIEGSIVSMITPLCFPWNIIAYIAIGAATFWLFICSKSFQNKLMGFKNTYEQKVR